MNRCAPRPLDGLRVGIALVTFLLLVDPASAANTWSRIGLAGEGITAIQIDPTNPQVLYAAANGVSGMGGVFKSTNGGSSWVPTGNIGIGGFPTDLVIQPSNTQVLYVAAFFAPVAGVSKSTNGGTSWAPVNTGLTDTQAKSLVINHAAPQTVYVATEGGVFRSTNGGASWSAVNSGLTNQDMSILAIDPANAQILYGGTFGGGVFKSTNGGGSWSAINAGLTNTDVRALAVDPSNPQTLYAGTVGGGIFKSTNGGSGWSRVDGGMSSADLTTLVIDPSNPQILYAGTFGGGVRRSSNGGASWSAFNIGLTDLDVLSLAIDPSDPATVYAGASGSGQTNGGVFKLGETESSTLILPQMFRVPNGDSVVVLQNIGAERQGIDVEFFTQNGASAGRVTANVNSLGEAQVATPAGQSGQFQGSAVISGTGPFTARGQWNFNVGGRPVAVGVPAISLSQTSTTFHIPIGTVGANSLVGVAIQNPGSNSIDCTASYRNPAGQAVTSDQVTVPGSGQASQFASGLGSGFEGSGTVQCNSAAAVVAVIQELVNGFPTILFAAPAP